MITRSSLGLILLLASCQPQGSPSKDETPAQGDSVKSERDTQESKRSSRGPKGERRKGDKEPKEVAPTPVEVSVVSRGTISLKLRAVSILEPKERASVRSLISGVITDLKVEEGDRVKADQLIAKISRPGATSLLRQAASSYQKSRQDVRRIEGLVKKGLAPREELNQAQFQKKQSALELSRLRAESKNERVTSPISGVIVSRAIYRGETVSPGQQIVEVMDLSEVYAPLNLSDRWAHKVRRGLRATLFDREGGALVEEALVTRVSPIINAETGTFKVWVSPPPPPKRSRRRVSKQRRIEREKRAQQRREREALLKPGLFVTVEMVIDRHQDALIIPRESVMYRDGVPFVAVVREEKAHLTQVRVGFTEEETIEILHPLVEGDLVVSFGQRGLEDQEPVLITKTNPGRESQSLTGTTE